MGAIRVVECHPDIDDSPRLETILDLSLARASQAIDDGCGASDFWQEHFRAPVVAGCHAPFVPRPRMQARIPLSCKGSRNRSASQPRCPGRKSSSSQSTFGRPLSSARAVMESLACPAETKRLIGRPFKAARRVSPG